MRKNLFLGLCPVFVCASLLLISVQATAQEFRGSISGQVTDRTGVGISGAQVTATNTATNVGTKAATDSTGGYTVLYLTPGQYTIAVEAPGFKKLEQKGIEVRVGDKLTLDLSLDVGTIQQEVLVTTETPLLQTSEASAGQVIDQRRIADLPLSDGNPFVLARLAPGVAYTGDLKFSRPFDNAGTSSIRAAGAPGGNEFLLDGAPNMASGLRVAYVPPSAAVQEFKVITANFDAQQGHTAGAVVNVITKSGTNTVHGSAYDFVRNDILSANDFFLNRAGKPRSALRYNRYGGTFGGPVWLPKIYKGKDRTFFFFAYEGFKDVFPEPNLFTVPTQAERNGDISALLSQRITIYDPATAVLLTSGSNSGRVQRQPLCSAPRRTDGSCPPGSANKIDPARLSPIAQAYLKFYPLPNLPGDAQGRDNYISGNPRIDNFNTETVRVDHKITEKQSMFFRYYRNWRRERRGNWTGTINDILPTGNYLFRINNGAIYDEVYAISPFTVLNLRAGFARFVERNQRPSEGSFDPSTLGFSPQVSAFFRGANYLPRFNIGGFSSVGDSLGDITTFNIYSLQPTLSRIMGGHSIRIGYDFRAYRENFSGPGNAAGRYDFGTDFTRGPLDNSPGLFGQELAAFLLGQPTGGLIDRNASRANQTLYHGIFFQDDWKITHRLTLNMGLRYEYEGATTERYNRNTRGFDFTDPSPIEAAAVAAYAARPDPALAPADFHVKGGLLFADSSNRGFWIPDKINFQPRIGAAYRLTDRVALRGGWAIFTVPFIIGGVNQRGFSRATNIVPSLDNGLTFQANLANPFPGGVADPPGPALGLATNIGQDAAFIPLDRPNGQAQRWDVNIQRQMGASWVLEGAYIGLRGYDLSTNTSLDTVPRQFLSTSPIRDDAINDFLTANIPNPFRGLAPGTGFNGSTIQRQQLLRPFPQFTGVGGGRTDGLVVYHSLQLRGEKRMSHGYTLTAAYTWSKALERTSFLNPTDNQYEKRLLGDDIPHRFTLSFIWELPFGQGRRWGANWHGVRDKVLGGWQAGGLYTAQSGRPIFLGNWVYFGDPSQLRTNISSATVDQAFPTAGFYFTDATVQTNGVVDPVKQRNDPRIRLVNNIRTLPSTESGFRTQPLNLWDGISLIKKTSIREQVKMEMRFEFLNAFNHPQFDNPNTDPTNSNFGKLLSQTNLPRNIQIGLKFTF